MLRNFYLLLLILLFLVNFACKHGNQNKKTDSANNIIGTVDSINSELKEKIKKTKGLLICNNKHINLKKVKKGSSIEQNFIFHNTGTETVELLGYEASCNCTELKLSKNIVSPKDSVSIIMIVETENKGLGNDIVNTTIKTNGQRTFYHLSLKFELVN
ncbi:DUF1573 domain-containing protein [Aureibaculum sp. 2210JD6-5]|uniref:DUF1573 domain-containing protein n=1 Tax=Aureibaculum sp. 2210JD6-5 TaxID=3103957 RepID=UPI002AADF18B|nr:DUF1573 domain-containing protein [Aureibaculum sp. 2210JD6-5]MDY7396719.1 DUF1573 domain-containing protein [Aureibaculum sp. 2210JD6-5]